MKITLVARRWLLAGLSLALALNVSAALAGPAQGSTPISMWKVTNPAGHTLYLVGSMHALTQKDLPLPAAYNQAFEESDRLVEELNLKKLNPKEVNKQALAMGLLHGKTLANVVGKKAWARMQKKAQKSGVILYHYEHFKPWLAAIGIGATEFLRYGYQPQLGLDMHFAELARKRNMPSSGLETVAEQLSYFNDMTPRTQRRFLIQTLNGANAARRQLRQLHNAWLYGDTAELAKLQKETFKGFPGVRKRMIKDRNERWLPHLVKCLKGTSTCFVVVGVEHMVGPNGLIRLLKARGDRVHQMHGHIVAPGGGDK